MKRTSVLAATGAAIIAASASLHAQETVEPVNPGRVAATNAAFHLQQMIVKSAEAMTEEDYGFRPVAGVRTFGELVAHVAASDAFFCSTAGGRPAPARDTTATSKAELQRALLATFAFCDSVYAAITPQRETASVRFSGRQIPVLTLILYRTHHGALHYGNMVTYLRMRGKVPPSSQLPGT